MTTAQFITILMAFVAHTGALFYWGGRTAQLLKSHDDEIHGLRKWKHDEVIPQFTELKVRVGLLEQQGQS